MSDPQVIALIAAILIGADEIARSSVGEGQYARWDEMEHADAIKSARELLRAAEES